MLDLIYTYCYEFSLLIRRDYISHRAGLRSVQRMKYAKDQLNLNWAAYSNENEKMRSYQGVSLVQRTSHPAVWLIWGKVGRGRYIEGKKSRHLWVYSNLLLQFVVIFKHGSSSSHF